MHLIPLLFTGILLVMILGFKLLYRHIRDLLLKGKDYKSLSKKEKLKYFTLAFIPVLVLIFLCVLFPFFWIVPLLHLFLFWAIIYIVVFVTLKILPKKQTEEKKSVFQKKGSSAYWITGALALAMTLVYMSVSFFLAHRVFMTEYRITTDKDVQPIRVALIADSHIDSCINGDGFEELMKEIEEQHPDVVVFVGDFVDDESAKTDMIQCCKALGGIDTSYGVYYVPGNHDAGYYSWLRGYTYDDLTSELRSSGITVLEDQYVYIGDDYCIVGRNDKSMDRVTISELMEPIGSSYYTIVLDHQPEDYEAEAAAGCDLVLSGHTHGGHMFPIALLAEVLDLGDAVYGMDMRGNTNFIVTSGISNWAISFRSGTISEYCIIDIVPAD